MRPSRVLFRQGLTAPVAICALVLLLSFAEVLETWGEDPPAEDPAAEILRKLPAEPDLLINLQPWELPSTSDMVQMGKRITPGVTNGLINNMDPKVRAACAAVLTATRDPRALQPLLDALDDPDDQVRMRVIQALASLESRAATLPLLALLAKPQVPASVKAEAIRGLGQLGDPASLQPLLQSFYRTWDPDIQQALWSLRRHLSPADLEALVVRPLQPKNVPDVPAGVLAFSVEKAGALRLKSAAQPLRLLLEGHPEIQNQGIHSLGLIGEPASLPLLRGLLDQTADARLLNNVVFALDRLGQDVEPFLRQAIADRRAYVRFNAAFVAGDLGSRTLADELIAALADRNDFVRSEVAVALGKLRAPEGMAALELASHEENPVVRRDALLALAAVDYPRYRDRVVSELVASELRSVREKAIRFLVRQADPQVVSKALASLDPESYDDQQLALDLLGSFSVLDDPDAIAFLLRMAASGSNRHRALVLLARYRSEPVRFILRQWLSQPSGEQDQLLRAMGLLRDADSRPQAERWLGQRLVQSQLYGAFALACLGVPAGAERLLVALEESPPELKQIAAVLLAQLDLASIEGLDQRLGALLKHEDVYVRLNAARALAQKGAPEAFECLKSELDKRIPFIQDEVLDIMERSDQAFARPVLRKWLEKADPMLRRDLERLAGEG